MLDDIKRKILHGGGDLCHEDMEYLFRRIEAAEVVIHRTELVSKNCGRTHDALKSACDTINIITNDYLRGQNETRTTRVK